MAIFNSYVKLPEGQFKSKLQGFIMIYRDLPGKMVISEISGYLRVLHVQSHVLVVWS